MTVEGFGRQSAASSTAMHGEISNTEHRFGNTAPGAAKWRDEFGRVEMSWIGVVVVVVLSGVDDRRRDAGGPPPVSRNPGLTRAERA